MIDPLMFIALLPAVVLVVYIYRKDRTDKEPPALRCGCSCAHC